MNLTVSGIYNILRMYNALIVHFSGAPKGAGVNREGHLYPNDLLHVKSGNAQGGLSCSTVIPSDKFYGFERNATGCIGVVLGLQTHNSLVTVNPEDCGSIEDQKGVRNPINRRKLTLENIECSILNRPQGCYNEWAVRDYVPLGIFAVRPFEISKIMDLSLPEDMPEYLEPEGPTSILASVTMNDICNTFPDSPIYGFHNGELCECRHGNTVLCSHDQIYHI